MSRRWNHIGIVAVLTIASYVSSYLALGVHSIGPTRFVGTTLKTRHDHSFAFDPWFYVPIAWIEYRFHMHGPDAVVCLIDERVDSVRYDLGGKVAD